MLALGLRRLAGRPAARARTTRVSQRLFSLGLSERIAARILYLVGLAAGGVVWALTAGTLEVAVPVMALFILLVTLLGLYLARVPASANDLRTLEESSFAPILKDLSFRWRAGEVLLDLVLIVVCYYLAYRVSLQDDRLDLYLPFFAVSLPAVVGVKVASFYVSGLYQTKSWQTFGLAEMRVVFRGVGLGSLLSVLVAAFFYRMEGFPRTVLVLDALLLAVAVIGTRASFRAVSLAAPARRSRRVLVYGAGAFGQVLVREMRENPDWRMNPVAFVDDDPAKAQRWIEGLRVRGGLATLNAVLERYSVDEVVLSSPEISGSVEDRVGEVCAQFAKPVRRFRIEIS